MKRDAPPVIFTDDCWIFTAQASVTAADLKNKVVDGYADTCGALWWSIGDHEVYLYETEIGELFGADNDALDPTSPSFVHSATPDIERQLVANLRQLIATSGGPLTTPLSDLYRNAAIPFFPRVRVNSHYVIDIAHPDYGSFRRENPELLIGRPSEIFPENSVQWGIRNGLDFAYAADLATLKKLDKRCEISPTLPFSPTEGHSTAFRHAHPSTQLPVPLPTDADLGPTLTIRVSGEIQEITGNLTLRLQNLAPDDRLEVRLNSHALSWDWAQVNFDSWVRQQVATLFWANYLIYPQERKMEGISAEYAIDDCILLQGVNEIEIRLKSNHLDKQTMLTSVELLIIHPKY